VTQFSPKKSWSPRNWSKVTPKNPLATSIKIEPKPVIHLVEPRIPERTREFLKRFDVYRNDKSRLISLPISNHNCNSVCLKWGRGNSTDTVESDAKRCLASALLEQIKISCYTEYKAFASFTNLPYVKQWFKIY
jgi:hypothetical protein